ncbi:MAG: alkaline phosphatase D family protein [Phycisphaerales bacterium]|nr:alkaline phosphatase D family protein [Phycisphaerales bacterium]
MATRIFALAAFAAALLVPSIPVCGAAPAKWDWSTSPDRHWPGSDWVVNRVQDWRVRDGALECTPGLPLRTAHLLTARLDAAHAVPGSSAVLRTVVEPLGESPRPDAFIGVLLGIGGDEVDYRLSALVQQVPGPGGGMLALLDGQSATRLVDFSVPFGDGGFRWSLPSRVGLDDLTTLVESAPAGGAAPVWRPGVPVVLEIRIVAQEDGRFAVEIAATVEGRMVGACEQADLPVEAVQGGIALVVDGGTGQSVRSDWRIRSFEIDAGAGWIERHPERRWGPVLGVLYTLDREEGDGVTMRLTAQLPVLPIGQLSDLRLEIEDAPQEWSVVALGVPVDGSFTVPFVATGLDDRTSRRFRVAGAVARGDGSSEPFEYQGNIRARPTDDRTAVVASMSCVKHDTGGLEWNRDGKWFPHSDLVASVVVQDPDLLYFAGDQLYEGDLTGPDGREPLLDYRTRWQRFLWAFGALTRMRPTIVVTDDHDVYQGNLWGAGGVRAVAHDGLSAQDAGGFKLPPDIVNAIFRTQTSHLPPAAIAGPIGAGIMPYTTRVRWGPFDCAVLSDRMWKDSASVLVPEGSVVNGWFKAPGFDPRTADPPGARLLGPEQEAFLAQWAAEPDPRCPVRLVLSQSPFVNVATLPRGKDDSVVPSLAVLADGERPDDDEPVADCDSNGWPPSAARRAVGLIAQAGALHLAGDQHLATLVQYGVDGFGDGPFVFTSPAMANTWARRWMPSMEGAAPAPDALPFTGDFLDGFGNRMTVWAVANPRQQTREPRRLHDLSPGYAVVRYEPGSRELVLEAWPRWARPGFGAPYPGWPFRIGLPTPRGR